MPDSEAPRPLPEDQPYFDMRRSANGRLSGLIKASSEISERSRKGGREERTRLEQKGSFERAGM